MILKQSSAQEALVFLLVLSSDHITGATGLSPTVTLSKNGGAFASPSGAVSEIANGWYKVAGNATDTATLGPLILHATGTATDPVDMLFEVVAVDPQSSAFGLVLAKSTNITGLNDIAATAIVSSGAITTSGGKVSGVTLVDTITTYTGNTVQTGDAYARIGSAGAGLTALGDARIANLDAAVSTRSTFASGGNVNTTQWGSVNVTGMPMPTYAQPSGFLAATFPGGTIASTTNITAGTIATVTNLTNAPTVGDFTATMKTSLNSATPASIVGAVGSVTGSVGSISGITFPTNFGSLGITAGGKIAEVALVDALTTYTGNTPQTGDSFPRIGAPVGASISADIATAQAGLTKVQAATYDSATVVGSTITLSNGHTLTVTTGGRVLA